MTVLKSWQRSIPSTIVGFLAIVSVLTGCSAQSASAPAVTATAGSSTGSASISTAAPSGAAAAQTESPTTTVTQTAATVTQTAAGQTTIPATPTVVPSPVATAMPETPAPTATTSPLSQPSATVAALAAAANGSPVPATGTVSSSCATLPVRGFALVWQGHAEVPGLVGCPTGAEAAIGVVSEQFEHGWMLQLSSAAGSPTGGRTVDVLFADNATVAQIPDTWAAGKDPITTGLTPALGLVEPQRDFGKVWREGTSLHIRERLGWAMSAERGAAGAWQPYQHGQMIWTPDPKQIFVIGAQGQATNIPNAWRLYPDLFVG